MDSTASVYDNKSSTISVDHFQQINDATSAVIPRHVLGERFDLDARKKWHRGNPPARELPSGPPRLASTHATVSETVCAFRRPCSFLTAVSSTSILALTSELEGTAANC